MNVMNESNHRPWPLPSKRWIMRQTWMDVFFAHWPIAPEDLRPFIPRSLQIDTYKNQAWIGVVIFMIGGVYPRGLSRAVSLTPSFPEINVRTYVKQNGKPGVYFLSLDVKNWASLHIAKRWFRLPYHPADISLEKNGGTFHFEGVRRDAPVRCKGTYTPLPEVYVPKEGTLDHWLTERYCLYSTDKRSTTYCGDVHHRPWPLQKVKAEVNVHSLFSSFPFEFKEEQPLTHYSQGVETLIWNIKKID